MSRNPFKFAQAEIVCALRVAAQVSISIAIKRINIAVAKAVDFDRNVLWGDI